jgi:hypothetical protein
MRASRATASALAAAKAGLAAMMLVRLQKVCTERAEEKRAVPSFDKQYLRDWLSGQPWDKTPPPPALPKEVVEATQNKYLEAYRILTGSELAL